MNKYNITIDDSVKKEMLDVLKLKLKECDEEIVIINQKKKTYLEAIKQLGGNRENDIKQYSMDLPTGYNINSGWAQKVEYLLYESNKIMIASDLVERVLELEPNRNQMHREKTRKPLSGCLSNMVKSGELMRAEKGKFFAYGFKDWFTSDGKVKSEYDF